MTAPPSFARVRVVYDLGEAHDRPNKGSRAIASMLKEAGLDAEALGLPESLGQKGDVDDLHRNIGADRLAAALWSLPTLDSGSTSHQRRAFELTRLESLLAEPPEEIEWAVEDLLVRAGLSMLAAKPKVGKTTLARNLALCKARGLPFLGRRCTKGHVVVLALEEKRSEVAKHFRRMGATNEDIDVHVGSAPERALSALEDAITKTGAELAIVDPVFKLIRIKDGNDYAEVNRAFEPLLNLARRTGCHILTVHHMGKGERTGGDALLGSTAIFGAVDAALLMKKRDVGRTIESIQRYGVDLPETVITLDPETGVVCDAGDVSTIERDKACAAIIAALGTDTLTETEIKGRVGGNQTTTATALRHLVDTGEVSRSGRGVSRDPYHYRRMDETSERDGGTNESRFAGLIDIANRENRDIETLNGHKVAAAAEPARKRITL